MLHSRKPIFPAAAVSAPAKHLYNIPWHQQAANTSCSINSQDITGENDGDEPSVMLSVRLQVFISGRSPISSPLRHG